MGVVVVVAGCDCECEGAVADAAAGLYGGAAVAVAAGRW